jgi:hypothetical protein
MALQKGKFYNADTDAEVVTCHFNPSELVLGRTNTWKEPESSGSNLPGLAFTGTKLANITLQLLFDSYEKRTDVRADTDKILGLMDVPSGNNQARPPHVYFGWGQFRTFRAVIAKVTQTFTLFLETGTPVRAKLSVELQEVPVASTGQNPTSRAAGARRIRVIQPGDTIDMIAAQELGNAGNWRILAEANGLDDPRRLALGQKLYIPADL